MLQNIFFHRQDDHIGMLLHEQDEGDRGARGIGKAVDLAGNKTVRGFPVIIERGDPALLPQFVKTCIVAVLEKQVENEFEAVPGLSEAKRSGMRSWSRSFTLFMLCCSAKSLGSRKYRTCG